MKTFFEYVRDRGIEIPENNIPGSWFVEHGYPMVVRCACCEMTMALPNALIDSEGYTICPDCAYTSNDCE